MGGLLTKYRHITHNLGSECKRLITATIFFPIASGSFCIVLLAWGLRCGVYFRLSALEAVLAQNESSFPYRSGSHSSPAELCPIRSTRRRSHGSAPRRCLSHHLLPCALGMDDVRIFCPELCFLRYLSVPSQREGRRGRCSCG